MDPTDGGLNWSSHAFGPMSPFATESSRSAQPSCLALCGLLAKMLLVPEVRSFERELMGFREDFLHLLIELSNPGTPRTFQLFLSCSFLGQPQGPRQVRTDSFWVASAQLRPRNGSKVSTGAALAHQEEREP